MTHSFHPLSKYHPCMKHRVNDHANDTSTSDWKDPTNPFQLFDEGEFWSLPRTDVQRILQTLLAYGEPPVAAPCPRPLNRLYIFVPRLETPEPGLYFLPRRHDTLRNYQLPVPAELSAAPSPRGSIYAGWRIYGKNPLRKLPAYGYLQGYWVSRS